VGGSSSSSSSEGGSREGVVANCLTPLIAPAVKESNSNSGGGGSSSSSSSGSSSSSSSNSGSSSSNSGGSGNAFLAFSDAEDLVILSKGEASIKAAEHKVFKPAVLAKSSPEEIWKWWQARRMADSVLKSAIGSDKSDIRPYFDAYKPFLLLEKADILQTNADFFRAIAEADADLMKAIWLDSPSSLCLLAGHDNIYNGYQNITTFWSLALSAAQPNVQVRNIKLHFQGDLAIVTCVAENSMKRISSKSKKSVATTSSLVTNVFVKPAHSDRYNLVAHIASISPSAESKNKLQRLQTIYSDPTRAKSKSPNTAAVSIQQLMAGAGFTIQGGSKLDASDDDDDDDDDEIDEYEMDEDDEEREDDGGGEGGKDTFQKFRDALSRLQSSDIEYKPQFNLNSLGGDGTRVFVLNKKGNVEGGSRGFSPSSTSFTIKRSNNGKGGGSTFEMEEIDDKDDGGAEDEGSDEEDEAIAKELASRTLLAVRWLHSKGKITQAEKRRVTSDVIKNVGSGEFSKAEIAFSLLIGGGRPGEGDYTNSFDMSSVSDDDLNDFVDLLKIIM